MTFQPIVVGAGLNGWRFLQATYESQFEAFTNSAQIQRDVDYYRENITSVTSAEELVADRRLLSVALGAFGLEDDINNRYFIQKILEDGTTSDDALSSRLADDRYSDMSKAFGFGPGEVRLVGSDLFAAEIIESYEAQSFEVAVGNQDESMRIALYGDRMLQDMALEDKSDTTLWYNILSDPPLRDMFQIALGLPSDVSQIDIEQQLGLYQDKATRMFGDDSVAQFGDPQVRENLVTAYMARVLVNETASSFSPMATALQLLQS